MAINRKARAELNLEWAARYSDGSKLAQFDDKADEEYHFGHIDQGKLIEFLLVSKTDPKQTVSVNLETGLFYVSGVALEVLKIEAHEIPIGISFSDKKVEDKKLIYFRKVRRDFNFATGTMAVSIAYILGYEARVNGKKVKELLQVNPRGTITIYEDPEKAAGFTRL